MTHELAAVATKAARCVPTLDGAQLVNFSRAQCLVAAPAVAAPSAKCVLPLCGRGGELLASK